jgi:hypothetical protein
MNTFSSYTSCDILKKPLPQNGIKQRLIVCQDMFLMAGLFIYLELPPPLHPTKPRPAAKIIDKTINPNFFIKKSSKKLNYFKYGAGLTVKKATQTGDFWVRV